MANNYEVLHRNYIDTYSYKENVIETIVPKYFEDIPVSSLNIGLLGYTTELISDGYEDVFNTVSALHDEMYPNRAKLPSSILSYASMFQLSQNLSQAAVCEFVLVLNEKYILDHFEQVGGRNVFYIDKDTKILVEDIVFTLDYDIMIQGIKREVVEGYIYSAQYVIDDGYENTISDVTLPYIKVNKSVNGYVGLSVVARQMYRTIEIEPIINNTKINFPTVDITFSSDRQLAGFEVFYKSSTDNDFNTQLHKLLKYSPPLKTPFCFYNISDDNTLTISFSNRDDFFQPDFNSECKVMLYLTDGAEGNFDVYRGKEVTVVTNSERYSYNDNFFVTAIVMSPSSGGKDAMSLEALQALAVEGFRTGTVYATDNDLAEYFNNYKYRFDNDCIFIKKRDDVIDRLYSGFLIMRKDDFIFPTNTLYIDGNLGQFKKADVDKYILEPGALIVYDGNNNGVIEWDKTDEATLKAEYQQYLTDNSLTKEDFSFWDYLAHENKLDLIRNLFKGNDLAEVKANNKFVYTNPFLIAISKNPNLVGLYLTMTDDNSIVDFLNQNLDAFDQFLMRSIALKRDFDNTKTYTFSASIAPSSSLSVTGDIITDYGDITKCKNNTVRVVITLKDKDGSEVCYCEMVPMSKGLNDEYNFEAKITTDDFVTNNNKFRITDKVTKMTGVHDILIPMTTVVNVYILFKYNNPTLVNKFTAFDNTFDGYTWTNVYSTDTHPLTFIQPLNMIKSDISFKDYRLSQNQIGDCMLSSLPLIGVDMIKDKERFDYFISTFIDQYKNLEKSVIFLKTSTHIDLKFYNTYGKSKNFIIGDEVDGEQIIDTINIKIKYYVWVYKNTDQLKATTDLKQYIKDYIESVNDKGTNNFYNSNMVKSIENTFSYVHHIKFIGINEYDTKYQTVKNVSVDLNKLSKDERIKYVPEILVANLENIELTFFEEVY